MKKIMMLMMSVICSVAAASETCFDSAVYTVNEAKHRLDACGVHYHKTPFNKLISDLQKTSRSPSQYSQAVIHTMGALYEEYNTNLPYGPETRYNTCVAKELKSFSKIRLQVFDALVYCAP